MLFIPDDEMRFNTSYSLHNLCGGVVLRVVTSGVVLVVSCAVLFLCVCVDIKEAPLRLPKPLSDQFPVRVCSCPLCIITVCDLFLSLQPLRSHRWTPVRALYPRRRDAHDRGARSAAR